MIIECPECGKRGKVDAAKIPEAGVYAKCSECGYRIIVKRTGVVSQPEQPVAPVPPPPTVPPLDPDATLADPVMDSPGPPSTEPPSAAGIQPPATGVPGPPTSPPDEPVLTLKGAPPPSAPSPQPGAGQQGTEGMTPDGQASQTAPPQDTPGDLGFDGGFAQPIQRPVKEDEPVPPVQTQRKRALDNYELPALAKKNLQGKWGLAVLTGFVFFLITGVVSFLDFTGGIISLVISGPMTVGICAFYLDIAQGHRPAVSRIFFGFSRFLDSLIAYLVVVVMIILWTLLLIIPGIMAAFSYSMTFFILADEPRTGALDAWRKSKEIMKGNRMKLFWLPLRIGWLPILVWTVVISLMTIPTILGGGPPPPYFFKLFIVVSVIGMIGFVWFYIFFTAVFAQFYENIKDQQG